MKYFKFYRLLGTVASSLFLFCTCHASAMDPQRKAGTDDHGQEDLEKKYIDTMLRYQKHQNLCECDQQTGPIKVVLKKKIDKIVIEESAKQELKRLGVKDVDSIPINVLAYNYGIVAPAKKYLKLGCESFVPDAYLPAVFENVKKCNSIKLLNHPKEGIVLASDNIATVLRKKTVEVTTFGITRTETAFSLDKVECNS